MAPGKPLGDMPRDPDDLEREGVERQGNVMFWITLVAGALILVIAVIYAIVF
jgi:uncharacterized integral membrane protein